MVFWSYQESQPGIETMNQTRNSTIILSKTVKQKRIIENRIIRTIASYERCQESQNRVIENEFPLSKSIVKLLNKGI